MTHPTHRAIRKRVPNRSFRGCRTTTFFTGAFRPPTTPFPDRTDGRRYSVSLADKDESSVVIDNQRTTRVYGDNALRRGYRYCGAGLRISPADTQSQPAISRLVVLENGTPPGPAHSPVREALDIGQGRNRHWHDGSAERLFFPHWTTALRAPTGEPIPSQRNNK